MAIENTHSCLSDNRIVGRFEVERCIDICIYVHCIYVVTFQCLLKWACVCVLNVWRCLWAIKWRGGRHIFHLLTICLVRLHPWHSFILQAGIFLHIHSQMFLHFAHLRRWASNSSLCRFAIWIWIAINANLVGWTGWSAAFARTTALAPAYIKFRSWMPGIIADWEWCRCLFGRTVNWWLECKFIRLWVENTHLYTYVWHALFTVMYE